MAKNITLMGANYPDVPAVVLPQTGGGTAKFIESSEIANDFILVEVPAFKNSSAVASGATSTETFDISNDYSAASYQFMGICVVCNYSHVIDVSIQFSPSSMAGRVWFTNRFTNTFNANALTFNVYVALKRK